MLDRRTLLLAGAGALAGIAPASAAEDSTFRAFVERLGTRSRVTRPFLLRGFDARRRTAADAVFYEALLPGADADAALARRAWGSNGLPYAVTHRSGAYRRAAELRTEDRVRISVREVNRDTNKLEAQARRGVAAPACVLDATIPAVEAAARRAAGSETHEPLAEALERQLQTLRAQRAQSGDDIGVWRLPDGDEFYAQTLQYQLGAPVDPREAHGEAMERCRALQRETDALLRAQGLTQGSVGERLRAFAAEPRFSTASVEAKRRVVEAMNAQLARTRALLAPVLADVGGGGVRRLSPSREANGAQGRRQGANYLVDLGGDRASWSFGSVVHHELFPGHILQSGAARTANAPALQARYSGGYAEGWSIYGEHLADELGAFEGDAPARIGYLQWMLFRIARVVADTGIHAMRWRRERAIAEMRALQGDSVSFVSIADDVTRFCAQPGAFAVQGLAALQILELRERTRRAARQEFTLARFHDAMLTHGPLSPPGLQAAARLEFAL